MFAISAVDIALWDLRGKREGKRLWQLAGGAGRSCDVYYGGIDLQFPLEKLLARIRGYLDRGFPAVKIKVGGERLEEDIQRVRAVRELIGDGMPLAMGENLRTIREFGDALQQAKVAYTTRPWRRIRQASALSLTGTPGRRIARNRPEQAGGTKKPRMAPRWVCQVVRRDAIYWKQPDQARIKIKAISFVQEQSHETIPRAGQFD